MAEKRVSMVVMKEAKSCECVLKMTYAIIV